MECRGDPHNSGCERGQNVPYFRRLGLGHLYQEADAERFGELATLLYEQAALVEGDRIGNPIDYVQRLNRLLIRLTGTPGAAAPAA